MSVCLVFLQGYKQRRCFVATQAPLPNTVVDLWRMVWKQESRTIVMLCDLVENGRVRFNVGVSEVREYHSSYTPDVNRVGTSPY